MANAVRALFLEASDARAAHVHVLDGLRGLAVLIVIGSHLSNAGWLPFPNLSGIGKSGVYLFFVLSAYLLTRAILGRSARELASARYWANYALRRILRIWPLYLVILLASWWLTRAGVTDWHYQIDTAALKGHLALREGQSVLWSIPVEFTFYLWLPLIAGALVVLRGLPGGRWWGVLLLLLLMLGACWHWPAADAPTNGVKLGPYLVVFLCGMAAAWVQRQWPELGCQPRAWQVLGWLLVLTLMLVTPSFWAWLRNGALDPELNHRWFTAFGVGWALLLLALVWGRGVLGRLFACQPMRLAGVVSFSVYLWHMPVMQAAEALGVRVWGWLGVVILLTAILLVAMASFLLFERPWRGMRWGAHTPQRSRRDNAV